MNNAEIRPRRESGTTTWEMVDLNTSLMMSVRPASASSTRTPHSDVTNATAAMNAPQPAAATITARPCRCMRPTHPLVSAPMKAPAAGAE